MEETAYTVTAVYSEGVEKSIVIHLISVNDGPYAVTKDATVQDLEGNPVIAEDITSSFYKFYSFAADAEYTVVNQDGAVVISHSNAIWKYKLPSFKEVIDHYRVFDNSLKKINPSGISYSITSDDMFTHYRTSSNCPEDKTYVYTYQNVNEQNKYHFCVPGGSTQILTTSHSAIVKDSLDQVITPNSLLSNTLYEYFIPNNL